MRYAANMLSQYRVTPSTRKRVTCESRIVVFRASDPQSALATALLLGRKRAHRYRNVEGGTVHVAFIGLIDLIELDPMCERDEMWYRMFTAANPRHFVKPTDDLAAISSARHHSLRSSLWAMPASPSPAPQRTRPAGGPRSNSRSQAKSTTSRRVK